MSKIYVIGGANVDISARSFNQIVDYDSNPGKVSYSFGGVAHNIARNLSNIGCKVDYITAFSNDHFGRQLVNQCVTAISALTIPSSLMIRQLHCIWQW